MFYPKISIAMTPCPKKILSANTENTKKKCLWGEMFRYYIYKTILSLQLRERCELAHRVYVRSIELDACSKIVS